MRLYVAAFRVVRAQLGGEFVEDAVDEFVAVGAAVGFGDFDGFVDDDGVGGFRHRAQFVASHQQDGAFDGAEVFFVAVEQGADLLDVFSGVGVRAEEEFVEQLFVRFGEVGLVLDVFGDFGGGGVVDAGLVEGLYG